MLQISVSSRPRRASTVKIATGRGRWLSQRYTRLCCSSRPNPASNTIARLVDVAGEIVLVQFRHEGFSTLFGIFVTRWCVIGKVLQATPLEMADCHLGPVLFVGADMAHAGGYLGNTSSTLTVGSPVPIISSSCRWSANPGDDTVTAPAIRKRPMSAVIAWIGKEIPGPNLPQ